MSMTETYALDRVGETNEDESFDSGPLSMLTECVRNRIQVLVSCRNNRKLLGYLKAFDRHFNLLMEEVTELWTERPKKKKKRKNNKTKQQQPQNKDRFLKKLFIRGDSVIIILKIQNNCCVSKPQSEYQEHCLSYFNNSSILTVLTILLDLLPKMQ